MAQHLSATGICIHWLRGPEGGQVEGRGKAPIHHAWQQRPCESILALLKQRQPGWNLGIRTGAVPGAQIQLLAVDCDDDQAVRWARDHLPPTPVRVLTRQGHHLWYRRPETIEPCRNRAKVGGLRLDIRCDGGNLVAPPSVHPSGFVYRFDGQIPDALTLRALPVFDYGWLPSASPQPVPPPPMRTGPAMRCEDSDREARRRQARAIGLCRTWQVSDRGNGHGTDTFKLAGYLVHEIQLTEQEALDILLSVYNPRCPQPYPEALLQRKVSQAAHLMRSPSRRLGDAAPAGLGR